MVRLGAELQHSRGEQAPLHAGLDLQRRVGRDELLEAGDVAAVVFAAAEALRERAVHGAALDQEVQLAASAGALLGELQAGEIVQRRVLGQFARAATDVRPGAEQLLAQAGDVHRRHPCRCAPAAHRPPHRCDARNRRELRCAARALDLLAWCDVNHG